MYRPRVFASLFASLFAMLMVACSAQEPRHLEAEFVLATIAGDPLPALLYSNESVAIHLTADTIRLFRDGTGERIAMGFFVSGGAPPQDHESRSAFTYRLIGSRLEISYVCPPEAFTILCVPPPHVIAGEAGAQLTVTMDGHNRVPQVFARVP